MTPQPNEYIVIGIPHGLEIHIRNDGTPSQYVLARQSAPQPAEKVEDSMVRALYWLSVFNQPPLSGSPMSQGEISILLAPQDPPTSNLRRMSLSNPTGEASLVDLMMGKAPL